MSVLPYIVLFNGVLFAIQAILMGLHMSQLIQVPSIMGKAAFIAACFATAALFLRRQKRPPNKHETWVFAAGGSAMAASISTALFAGAVPLWPEIWTMVKVQTAPLGAGWITAITFIVLLAHIAILYFFFGPVARWIHEQEEYRSRRL